MTSATTGNYFSFAHFLIRRGLKFSQYKTLLRCAPPTLQCAYFVFAVLFLSILARPISSSFIETLVAAPEPHNDDVGTQTYPHHHHHHRIKHHQSHPPASALFNPSNFDASNGTAVGQLGTASSGEVAVAGAAASGTSGSFATLDEVLESHSQYPSHNDLLYLSALLEVSPKEAQNILRANWTHLQNYLVATPGGHGTSPTARRMKKPSKPSSQTVSTASTTPPTTTTTTTAATTTTTDAEKTLITLNIHNTIEHLVPGGSLDGNAPNHHSSDPGNPKHVALLHIETLDDIDDNDDDDGDGPVCRFSESTMLGLAAEYGNQTSRMIRFLCLNTPDHYLHLFSFEWEYVGVFLSMAAFVFALALAKIIFHVTGLVNVIPDSCILILLGFMVGAMLKVFSLNHIVTLYVFFEGRFASVFFLLLLPPIILESAYMLYDREFLKWFATVMLFAVVGTLLNAFIVGPMLYLLNLCGAMGGVTLDLTFLGCMTFASLISAVDPVAVLALFSELGVNPALYFLVFGESLFNDAVTVVMFNTFHVLMFESEHITATHIFVALAKFFLITFGGIVIGFVFGIITTLLVKYTEHCRVVEPLLFFVLAYGSYLLSELFHFSGIIGLIACGLTQWHYATRNASNKSRTTVKYFSKMLASLAESAVFVGFGILLIEEFAWHTGFICWTLFLITVVRFGVTFGLSALANRVWLLQRKITYGEQFIMSYGGLRGAIAFALSVQLNPRIMGGYNYYHRYFGFDTNYELMVTTTTVVILFTVFVQGITLKPIIGCLNVREVTPLSDDEATTKAHPPSAVASRQQPTNIFAELNQTVLNHVHGGMNAIITGEFDDAAFGEDDIDFVEEKSFLRRLQLFDTRHIKPWLLKKNHHRRKKFVDPNANHSKIDLSGRGGARPITTTIDHISEIIAAATAYYATQLQQTPAVQQLPQQIDLNLHNNNNNSENNNNGKKMEQLWQAAARSKALLKRQRQSVMLPTPPENRSSPPSFASSMSMANLLKNETAQSSDASEGQQTSRQIVSSLDNMNKEIIYNNVATPSVASNEPKVHFNDLHDKKSGNSNHHYSNLAFLPDNPSAVSGAQKISPPQVAAPSSRWQFPPQNSVNNNDRIAARAISSIPSTAAMRNDEAQQLKTALSQSLDKIVHYRAARRYSVSRDGVQDSDIDTEDDDDDDGALDANTCGRAAAAKKGLALRRQQSSMKEMQQAIQRTLTLPIDVDVWKAKINKTLALAAANAAVENVGVQNERQSATRRNLTRSISTSAALKSATNARRGSGSSGRLFNGASAKPRNGNVMAMRKISSSNDWNSRRRSSQPTNTIDEESILPGTSSSTASPVHRSNSEHLSVPYISKNA